MAKDKKAAKELTMEEKLAQALVPVEEQPYKIPENWCWTTIDKVTYHISDGSHNPPINSEKGIPLLSAANIHNGIIDFESANRWITEKDWEYANKRTKIELNDVLVTIVATIGRVAIVKSNKKFALQRSVAVLKPIINSDFLAYYLESPFVQSFMTNNAKGTAQKGFYLKTLAQMPCIIAPTTEQQCIVDHIKSIFAKLDEAKEKAQAVVDSFELRKSAILHKAFTGELTKQWREKQGLTLKSWKHKKFSEICDVVRGGSPRPAGNPKFYGGSIPFMKVADITQNNSPFVSSTKHTIKEEGLKKTRMVAPNTLLLTNSGATLGVPAITLIQTTFNDGIAAFLNLKSDNLLFYYYFWMSKTNELRGINKGAAQPNLNTDIIGAIEIDIPKEDEQTQIVMILKYLIGKEEQVKEAAESVIEKIETMKKTVLACAFQGKLGTNDLSEVKAVEVLKQVL